MLLIGQLKEIYVDGELEMVDTTNWFPKVLRKDFTVGMVVSENGLDDSVGRSPDRVTPEDVRRYQLRLASIRTTVPTLNAGANALRFFFKITLKRRSMSPPHHYRA